MIGEQIQARFPQFILAREISRGDDVLMVARDGIRAIARDLKEDPDFDCTFLMELTAVDYLGMAKEPRFEVVYVFHSMEKNHRIRVRVPVEAADPVVDSLTPLYPAADWFEREVWDMFGIRFQGHPNLKRLLMYESFEGHPLRKDYPVNQRQPLIGPKN